MLWTSVDELKTFRGQIRPIGASLLNNGNKKYFNLRRHRAARAI
jgi:hypothetical protein